MMMWQVSYGERQIKFEVIRKDVKHINLTVQPNQHIFVSANKNVEVDEIKSFVRSKGRWITSKLNYFQRTAPYEKIPREYVTGETFWYLGRQYRLKVFATDAEEFVRYFRGTIEMYVRDMDEFQVKEELMTEWYEQRQEIVFTEALNRMHELVRIYNIERPQLETRQMKLRWGSYIPRGNKIILNKDLIIAPRFCIDYVVLHELLHFKYPDHDFNFFNQLQLLMPDWRERKRILDEEVAREVSLTHKTL